ncbi:MAG: heparinase II/III family protein [Pseudomonadota bacterium]
MSAVSQTFPDKAPQKIQRQPSPLDTEAPAKAGDADPLSQIDRLLNISTDLHIIRSNTRSPGLPALEPVWRVLRQLGYASLLYGLRLKGQFPARLIASPSDIWPGDPEVGALIAQGIFRHEGMETSGDIPDFTDPDLPLALKRWLHSFVWLRDLASLNDPRRTRAIAEPALKEWLSHYSRWDKVAWAPDVTGQRLISLINHAPLVLASQDLVYRSQVLNAMAQQGRHLARTLGMAQPGLPRIIASTGLAFSSLLLPGGDTRVKPALKTLETELSAMLLSDGMAESRNPEDCMTVLRALITLRDSYRAARKTPPTFLHVFIDKVASALKGVRLPGAGVAAFNGACHGQGLAFDTLVDMAESDAASLLNGRAGGYQRIEAGSSVAILDAGLPARGALSYRAHAGLLALSFASGNQPIFINCGSGATPCAADLPEGALRATAAHSAIVINDTNAAQIKASGVIGKAPKTLDFGRDVRAGGEAVLASSACYGRRYGLALSRGLWLRGDGAMLLGRDEMTAISGKAPGERKELHADIRFHIHPNVTVTLTGGGAGALLTLPDKSWWTMRCQGALLTLEPSVYVAAGETRPLPTQQLVLSAAVVDVQTQVYWSLTRG